MSTLVGVADAVAAHINAGTYSRPVIAERMYQPAFTLEDLKDLRVSVVPRTVGISAASRDSSTFECIIDVGVQQKLPAEAEQAEIDALLDLVEEIADRLRLTRLPGAPEAAWVGLAHEPVVSSESLEQHRVFTSVLSVTYRVRR
ncbi:MAG: hypothetical protein BroJett014_31480 [Planctomycetota bacterium]|nr:MAG: hypothetical protein BroJett014_31480 [Planctomycetota bacterium]